MAKTKEAPVPLDCGYCGENEKLSWSYDGSGKTRVRCTCGVCGPWQDKHYEAIEAWNWCAKKMDNDCITNNELSAFVKSVARNGYFCDIDNKERCLWCEAQVFNENKKVCYHDKGCLIALAEKIVKKMKG